MTTVELPATQRHARRLAWLTDPTRRCIDQPLSLFFPCEVDSVTGDEVEPAYPPPEVKAICDPCPVRADCLEWALNTGQEFGIFGGMTAYERSLISKPKQRASCPGCPSDDVIVEGAYQLCLACGLSWPVIS